MKLYKNSSTAINESISFHSIHTNGTHNFMGRAIVDLDTNDTIEVKIRNVDDSTDLDIWTFSFSVYDAHQYPDV
jgi:S-adenosylmethionine synthetase